MTTSPFSETISLLEFYYAFEVSGDQSSQRHCAEIVVKGLSDTMAEANLGDPITMNEPPSILRPIPLRTFDFTTTAPSDSSTPITPATPNPESAASLLEQRMMGGSKDKETMESPSRTRSLLNLTSSTLFGIYSPANYAEKDESTIAAFLTSPKLRTGAGTTRPAESRYPERPRIQRSQSAARQDMGLGTFLLPLATRMILLFMFGVAYGVIVAHLHDEQRLAPVKVKGFFDRYNWPYSILWGMAGVGLGSLLPWVDIMWEDQRNRRGDAIGTQAGGSSKDARPQAEGPNTLATPLSLTGNIFGGDWNPVVRSIGAFVGIAFAIVCFPPQFYFAQKLISIII